jgi:hypothetical protein
MHDVPPSAALDNALPVAGPGGVVVSAESSRAAEIHRRVIALTKTLFPGEPQIEVVTDPEFGDWAYSVSVHATGDVQELVSLSERWHSGLLDAAEELAGIYCLSLVPTNESR